MNFNNVFYSVFLIAMLLLDAGVSTLRAQESMSSYIQNADSLVVYKDVPGLKPSEFYEIRVRSAATGGQWVPCYANITRSLLSADFTIAFNTVYYGHVKCWSHTYANIEMSPNCAVELE